MFMMDDDIFPLDEQSPGAILLTDKFRLDFSKIPFTPEIVQDLIEDMNYYAGMYQQSDEYNMQGLDTVQSAVQEVLVDDDDSSTDLIFDDELEQETKRMQEQHRLRRQQELRPGTFAKRFARRPYNSDNIGAFYGTCKACILKCVRDAFKIPDSQHQDFSTKCGNQVAAALGIDSDRGWMNIQIEREHDILPQALRSNDRLCQIVREYTSPSPVCLVSSCRMMPKLG
eukprot:TRINITY_DN11313_c0_g1_i1.p1 TRINITY_DN11313_c0_g1~~TRINITY_DN11313_c0_g1_i1.p1  ORF type:complete len:227 (+),score=62.43 TRINITY_DN11313_c0_g1_i1:119-799(+)